MNYEVRHSIRGRLRLRVPALRENDAFAEMFLQFIGGQPGVISARYNGGCSSVVIVHESQNPGLAESICELVARITPQQLRSVETKSGKGVAIARAPIASDRRWTEHIKTFLMRSESTLIAASVCVALSWAGSGLAIMVAVPAIAICSIPSCVRALTVLRNERRLNVDFLDAVAILTSLVQGSLFTAAGMLWLIALGEWIRDSTARKSQRVITELLNFQSRRAWILKRGKVVQVAAEDVRKRQTVVIYAGESIPVDGKVLRGTAVVDQRAITGESLPIMRSAGEYVFAGTVVREGKLYVRAQRVGLDTTVAHIVKMVQSAPTGETRMQNYAEKFADGLVLPSLALASGLFAVTGNANRFVSMTIIDYGTGMRVAAPISVLSTMIRAARNGVLIRSGSHLEKLNEVDTIVFDKTGTLTTGVLKLDPVISYDERHWPSRKIIGISAAVEARLKHPVAEAIVSTAKELAIRIPERSNSHYEIGLGARAQVNGYYVHLGNEAFFERSGIGFDRARRDLSTLNQGGQSTLLFAVDGKLLGVIPYADQIRPESREVMAALRQRGKSLVMITGDNGRVSSVVARNVGIERYFYGTLPHQKAEIIAQLAAEGRKVAMVGDGVNDSPALAHAFVGVAMKNGADVARESADVVLMEDNLWKLVAAIDASTSGMKLIRQNFAIIAGLNTIALALSIPGGWIGPGATAILSNGSAILASLNGVRPLIGY
jgi:Cu2+-exporting ATPase